MQQMFKSKKSRIITIAVVVLVVLVGGFLIFWMLNPKSISQIVNKTVLYNRVDDICPYIDLSPLDEIAGEVTSSKPKKFKGSDVIGCDIVVKSEKQPDGTPKSGNYTLDISANFSGESESEIQTSGEAWTEIWKKGTQDDTKDSTSTTFGEITDFGNDGYFTRFKADFGEVEILSYTEHIWDQNLQLSAEMSSILRGTVTGDEYNPYVRQILQKTMEKLQK